MRDLEDIGKMLQKSGKAPELRSIAESPEGKRLSGMLDANAVEKAAKSGDMETLRGILQQVMSTEDGKAIARKLGSMMEK